MTKSSIDFPLRQDKSIRLLPWIISFVIYLTTLALLGEFILNTFVKKWEGNFAGKLTIEVLGTYNNALFSQEARQDREQAVMRILSNTPGIENFRILSRDEINEILTPWLGANLPLGEEVAIPTLFDVDVNPALLDLTILGQTLEETVPGTTIENHSTWRDDIMLFIRAVRTLMMVVIGILVSISILIVIFSTYTGLATHRSVVRTLSLIGANNHYIARQFTRHILWLGIKGVGFSILLSISSIGAITWGVYHSMNVISWLTHHHAWLIIAIVPLTVLMLMGFVSRLTVAWALHKSP